MEGLRKITNSSLNQCADQESNGASSNIRATVRVNPLSVRWSSPICLEFTSVEQTKRKTDRAASEQAETTIPRHRRRRRRRYVTQGKLQTWNLGVFITLILTDVMYVSRLISNAHSEIFCQRSKVAMRAVCPCSHNPPAQRCKVPFLSLHRF